MTLSPSPGLSWGPMLLTLLLCPLLPLILLCALVAQRWLLPLYSFDGLLLDYSLLLLAAWCVCPDMASLAVLTTADLAIFETLTYLGQPVPEGFRACCYL